jgi:hypothetical protein
MIRTKLAEQFTLGAALALLVVGLVVCPLLAAPDCTCARCWTQKEAAFRAENPKVTCAGKTGYYYDQCVRQKAVEFCQNTGACPDPVGCTTPPTYGNCQSSTCSTDTTVENCPRSSVCYLSALRATPVVTSARTRSSLRAWQTQRTR